MTRRVGVTAVMSAPPAFEALRKRAYDLADTGRFADWEAVAHELEAEGFANAHKRVGADVLLRRLLTQRCTQAIERDA